jgi:hypothetical protein
MNYELQISLTKYQRLSTKDSFGPNAQVSKRQNPKKIKKFSNSLTPYSTTSYIFSVSSVTSVANVFFVPNAQLRPIVETLFFCASPATP